MKTHNVVEDLVKTVETCLEIYTNKEVEVYLFLVALLDEGRELLNRDRISFIEEYSFTKRVNYFCK